MIPVLRRLPDRSNRWRWLRRLSLFLALATATRAAAPAGYLFATFRGEATPLTEQISFMVSADGHDWQALNQGDPVLISDLGEKGVRDPFLLRSPTGDRFFLIATDLSINRNRDWHRAVTAGSKSIVVWESTDLVNWSAPRLLPVAPADAGCTWAPEAIYDETRGEYLVYWASTTARDDFAQHRIWAAYTPDFRTFSEPFIYIEKPTTIIDTTVVRSEGRYFRFTKDEKFKAITMEQSSDLLDGWTDVDGFSLSRLTGYEGPACFQLKSGRWCLLLDQYSKGTGYQAFATDHLSSGQFAADAPMRFPFHPVRHGTVVPISAAALQRLKAKWGEPLPQATSDRIKPINVVVDPVARTIELPVLPDTARAGFDPEFTVAPPATITPTGPQDFSAGPVAYQVAGGAPWQVSLVEHHNPVLAGYYADPDILYSRQTGRFYLYPTSDGFDGWSGTYFKTFSSDDLVHWRDEGIILDLKKDVAWADRNAWAPCIIEQPMGDTYRYFYYFTAAQKIGVAVADRPTGPFVDSGRPLVDFLPEGAGGGQQIDPAVFHDPVSGHDYLYWGNGYLAVAELKPDMVSLDRSSIKIITPDATFREGTTVFYRQGTYYFLWSEDDTRSPNYRVRYATALSPTGPLTIPADNLVLAKDEQAGIYGTGHNSVLQIPGRDEWYIVYHRFNYPKGILMGDAAGFHREVCIDRMTFAADGSIHRVIPTQGGIAPVQPPR